MLCVTKIFDFEMAHAIHSYNGRCQYIHGHSYQLHVTVTTAMPVDDYIPAPGIMIDFKDLKKIVIENVVDKFDHQLVLTETYIKAHDVKVANENLVLMEAEPTAENLLLFFRKIIERKLPESIKLTSLKLYETKNSYAEWAAQ